MDGDLRRPDIAGERLELARVVLLSPGRVRVLLAATDLLLTAAPLALLWPDVGTPLAGIALLLLVGWLMVNDVARRIRLARRDADRRAVPYC